MDMDSKTTVNNVTDLETKVSPRKKEKNYKREEDIFLCMAWMLTSKDKEETDESSMTFWERIAEKYISLIEKRYVIRPKYSLLSRWSKIRGAVSTFCAIYKNINDQKQNSYTENEMIKKALLAYKKEKKEKFKFLHCWSELRSSLKWTSEGILKVREKQIGQQSSIDEHLSLDDGNGCPLDTQILAKQCEREDDDALVRSPCTDACPVSAVSPVFICSSGVINFDPHNHNVTDVPTKVSEKVSTKKKEKNYTKEEDMFLCRAWVASTDPELEKDSISMTLWERITEAYASLRGNNYVPRKRHSLSNRWSKIRSDVTKFCSFYKNITDQNLGSYTELEKINLAMLTFRKECGASFKFVSCWNELKHSPTWIFELTNGVKFSRKKSAILSQQSLNGEPFNHKGDDDSPSMPTPILSDEPLEKKIVPVDTSLSDVEELLPQTHDLVKETFTNLPDVELLKDQPVTSRHSSFDDDYDFPMTVDTSPEELHVNILEEQEVGCIEGERIATASASPLATSSHLSALCTPVILSRGIDFNPHDDTDIQIEESEQVKTKKKGSNYTREEDVLLCRAWMGIVKANDESLKSVWERVVEKYGSLIGSEYVSRTEKSLAQRWNMIRPAVSKYSVIYKIINDQNSNGYTELDKINKARVTYKKDGNEKFRFHHCWTILKHSPKWNAVVSKGRSRIVARYSQEPITSEHSSFDDDYDSPMTIDTSSEELDENLPKKQEVRCREGECVDVVAACTPVMLSRTDVQTKVSGKVNTRKRESNYSEEEDIFLCKAWMATDADPVMRKDQSFFFWKVENYHSPMTLWERISEAYSSLIGNNYVSRTEHSLTNRWTRIRTAVAKYYSIYKNITDQNLGSSETEKVNIAALTYQSEWKEMFLFFSCWNELKHSPKWIFETTSGVRFRQRHEAMFSEQLANGEPFSHDENDNFPMPAPTFFDQSQGQKLVAEERKGQDDVETSSSDVEELLPQTHNLGREISADQPEVEKFVADQTSEYYRFDNDYDSPIATPSEEEQNGNLPEEQEVGCGEGERVDAASTSPPAASSRLSTLCTPVILSRDMDSDTHNHVRTDVQTEVSERVNTKKREKNYTEEEDVFLCRAWMVTDADPLVRDQSAMNLWERIVEEYETLIGNNYINRTEHSLSNRWSRIRTTVAKFYSYYKNITDENSCELEKINMAVLALQKESKERFLFLNCWHELKHSQKWNFELTKGVKYRRRHAAIFAQQSSNGEHLCHNNDNNSPMPKPTFYNQSHGEKPVLRKRKDRYFDTSSSDMEEILPQTHDLVRETLADQDEVETLIMRKRKERDGDTDQVRELLEQKVRKLDELLEIEREKRDTKIMLIDPSTLPDGRRQYFEKLQQKILNRVCGESAQSN